MFYSLNVSGYIYRMLYSLSGYMSEWYMVVPQALALSLNHRILHPLSIWIHVRIVHGSTTGCYILSLDTCQNGTWQFHMISLSLSHFGYMSELYMVVPQDVIFSLYFPPHLSVNL